MLRTITSLAAVLLFVASADAIWTFNNNDNNNMKFSNDFLSVTKIKCFGAVISDHKEDGRETEFDVCLFGVVGGLIVLIGLYPTFIAQGAPSQFLRRQDQFQPHQPEFRNPYDQQPQQSQQQFSGKPSVAQRFTNFFGGIAQKFQSQTQKLTDSVQERIGNAEASLYDLQQQVLPAKQPAQVPAKVPEQPQQEAQPQ